LFRRSDGRHLKQILLFGGSVLLPALVLLFFTIRMNRQDSELRERRAEEARQQKAEEIGRHMANRLGEAEQALLRELAADPGIIHDLPPTHSGLVFAGPVREGDLQMPWDSVAKPVSSARDDRSRELVLRAQQAGLSTNGLSQALTLLDQALSLAASAAQKSYVRLQIGAILPKSSHKEALRLYEDVLDQPGPLADEYGIPFPLYAADRLSELGGKTEPVLNRLEGLITDDSQLPSTAYYFIRDILGRLVAKVPDSLSSARIDRLSRAVEYELVRRERILTLKAFVTGWMSRRDLSPRADGLSTWEAHGDLPWLVSIREGLAGDASYLFAFDGPDTLSSAIERGGLTGTFPGSCQIAVGSNTEGLLPGSPFQGFRLRFEETGTSAWSSSSPAFPVLYWSILILVVGFTGFGMYLLWRDLRREWALADMKSHFAASVSHELKTPLTAIRMFAEALAMGVKSEPEAQQEYLRTIISESERLSRLLNNVLDFSKIEQGTRTYHFERVSLEAVVQAAAKAMAFAMGQKGFNLQIEADQGIPSVRGDKDALEQAVLNLLDNAMKYSGESRDLRLKLRRGENTVCIDITDFGIGISEENKSLVFGQFFRVPGSENRRIPGTGLGLTIVSHIAEAHGGRVEVLSRIGEGSTFSMILPLEEE
jgi:signal transduction histidine kinase